jgi:DNA repair protein RAD5
MADTDKVIPNEPPPGMFFAGSDEEEEEDVIMQPAEEGVESDSATLSGHMSESSSLPQTPQKSSPPSSPRQKLFLDDDDDDEPRPVESGPSVPTKRQAMVMEDSDIEVIEISRDFRPKSKNKTAADSFPISPPPEQKLLSPVVKKRRFSSPQRISAEILPDTFLPAYLGEIVVPNAWSNVSGKGYITANESVLVQRETGDAEPTKPKAAASTSGKKKPDGKKQITLTNMLKPQPPKATKKKKKTDTIVRLINNRGFGMLTDGTCSS